MRLVCTEKRYGSCAATWNMLRISGGSSTRSTGCIGPFVPRRGTLHAWPSTILQLVVSRTVPKYARPAVYEFGNVVRERETRSGEGVGAPAIAPRKVDRELPLPCLLGSADSAGNLPHAHVVSCIQRADLVTSVLVRPHGGLGTKVGRRRKVAKQHMVAQQLPELRLVSCAGDLFDEDRDLGVIECRV